MSDTPIVSIIVPVYRGEAFLRRCLDSLCRQTLDNIEMIMVNDASPDRCGTLLEECAQSDPRIRVMTHSHNRGAASARNSGLDAARGKYIGFVDADDYVSPTMYETLVRPAEEAGADLVACGLADVDVNGVQLGQVSLPNESFDLDDSRERRQAFSYLGYSCCNKLFRRDLLADLRYLPLVWGEDTVFAVNYFLRCHRLTTLSVPGYYYVRNPGSAMRQISTRVIEDVGTSLVLTHDLLSNGGVADFWSSYTDRCHWAIVRVMLRGIYAMPASPERERLWAKWLATFAPLWLQSGQPFWRRWCFRLLLATRSPTALYWYATFGHRMEERFENVIQGYRQEGWRYFIGKLGRCVSARRCRA